VSKEYKYNVKIADYLAKIIRLAFEVNCKTDYSVFVRFSGHVDNFEVEIGEGKNKREWEIKIGRANIYLVSLDEPKEVEKTLEKIIAGLEKILSKKERRINLLD